MCDQCATNATLLIENILPGYNLMVARQKGNAWINGRRWETGEYGLVRSNDPDFILPKTIIADPFNDFTEEEINDMISDDPDFLLAYNHVSFLEVVAEVDERLISEPLKGYRLVKACMEVGYNPEIHGSRLAHWLVHHVAMAVLDARYELGLSDG